MSSADAFRMYGPSSFLFSVIIYRPTYPLSLEGEGWGEGENPRHLPMSASVRIRSIAVGTKTPYTASPASRRRSRSMFL